MLAVEARGIVKQMKNWLFALCGMVGARHRAHAADMRFALLNSTLEIGRIRSARTGAGQTSKPRPAMERDAIIETALGEFGNALDMAGRKIGARSLMTASPVSSVRSIWSPIRGFLLRCGSLRLR